MIYLTSFNYMNRTGNVVVNTSTIYDEEAFNIIKDVFKSGLCVSPYINLKEGNSKEEIQIKTICGTTIDGILLNEGIPTIPLYGGLVKIRDYVPTKFTELISYKKTSVTPLDAFVAPGMTSVLDVINTGNGTIPANFRLIPSVGRERALNIINWMVKL